MCACYMIGAENEGGTSLLTILAFFWGVGVDGSLEELLIVGLCPQHISSFQLQSSRKKENLSNDLTISEGGIDLFDHFIFMLRKSFKWHQEI